MLEYIFYLSLILFGFVFGISFGIILGIFLTSYKTWTRKFSFLKWVYENRNLYERLKKEEKGDN